MTAHFAKVSIRRRIAIVAASLIASLVVIGQSTTPVQAESEGKGVPDFRPASIEMLSTRLEFPRGTVVHPGKHRSFVAVLHNSGFDTAKDFGVYVTSPSGTRVTTSQKDWTCSRTATTEGFKCSFAKDLPGETSTQVTFKVESTKLTPSGKSHLSVTPFTSSKKKIESQHSPYTVVDMGDAVMLAQVQHFSSNRWKSWTNGKVHKSFVDEKYTYRIVVNNEGHEVLKKGSIINLRQSIGAGIDISTVKVALGYGTCGVKDKKISCALRASKDIYPKAHLTTVDVTIIPRKITERAHLKAITVTNPVTKASHSIGVNMKVVERPSSVNIDLHHKTHGEVGGTAQVFVRLENISKDVAHKSFTMTAKLPRVITFTKVEGNKWACSQKNRSLECNYKGALAPKQKSTKADLFFKVSNKAAPSVDGYEIDFVSDHAVRRFHLPVLAAVQLHAEALPSSLATSSNLKNNMVRLDADGTVGNGNALKYEWVQRCTTAQDVANFDACPHGSPAPIAQLKNAFHPRAHAYLPKVSSQTTFVFELLVKTDSSLLHKTVKVKAKPQSVSAADVHAWAATTPTWISSALTNAQVVVSNPVLSNGNYTADATLPQSIMDRFSVPKNTKFLVTATEVQGKDCIVVHAGDTKTSINMFSFATANLKAKYFEYIVAPSACTFSGNTYNGLGINIHGDVFGNSLTFTGPVTLLPTLKVDAKATTTNLNVSVANNSFKFKNVIVGLLVDDAAGIAKVSLGGAFNVFGVDINVLGNISAPTGVGGAIMEGMQVSLTAAAPQTFKYDEVTLKDMSITVGMRYTPMLATDKGLLSVNGTGTIEFMGTSIRVTQMEVDFSNGQMVSAIFKVNANMKLPSMKEAKADLAVLYTSAQPPKDEKSKPTPATLSVDLTAVFVTDSGFSIGTDANPAYLHYRSGQCISMGGQVIVPGILDATVSGYLVTGLPCMPAAITMGDIPGAAKSVLSDVPLPVAPGDWRFDASNVKITLGGFTATGNFTIGKMYGLPYGSLDATIHLTPSDTKNTIYVKGSVDPLTGVKVKGEADLGVAGIVTHFTVDAALTSKDQHIGATAKLKLGGSTFELTGYFGLENYQGRMVPSQSFSASVPNFEIDGFKLGSADIAMSQTPTSASVSASLKVNLGLMKFDGSASFHTVKDGVAITVDADGKIKVSDKWEGDMSFHISTCGNDTCTTMGSLKVSAAGHAVLQGKKFDLGTVNFDTGGHFKEKIHYSDESCDKSGTKGGIQFEGCFKYTITALISDSAPYASMDADASLHVKSRSRCTLCIPRRWYGWESWGTLSAGIDIQFDPFKLHLHVGSINVGFNGV